MGPYLLDAGTIAKPHYQTIPVNAANKEAALVLANFLESPAAQIEKAKVEALKKGTEITVDGDVFLVKDKKGQMSAFTFVNGSTLLGTMGSAGTKDGVLAAAKGTSALKT